MTISEAKNFARNKVLKGTVVMWLILVLLLLFSETKSDFANGILFFLAAIVNIHTLFFLSILFVLTYLLGGLAGKEIIIKKQNIILVSFKYAILISLALSIYVIIASILREKNFTITGFQKIVSVYFLTIFLKSFISLLIVWMWATIKMKSKSLK